MGWREWVKIWRNLIECHDGGETMQDANAMSTSSGVVYNEIFLVEVGIYEASLYG